ncbi:Thiamine biosynthesis lipoprotein ApbE precursor [Pigmentiphaga humi]|uniref:FAD:protein FMN transferase n=1 Tax=Pigmentiphaga humi TaxID=2478468 RepID=A0A3P4B488_9BURK|nr:FAD:protein FMN transferase [Pigmentiphaga humi]VCU70751.1 Thiamine biosynthesis lipoprotein ApbE precursor [Pigmentiphaga humi]
MTRILVPLALSPDAIREHAPHARVLAMGGATMGTSWSVRFVDDGGLPADLEARAQAELDRVISQMSTWLESSDLSRFNAAPAGSWHALPPELYTVMEQALAVARDSGGAYDPTVGPLVNLWGFGPEGEHGRPDAQAVARVRGRVGWQRIELDAAGRRARQPGGAYVDLSGIAKGYAVDAVARCLRRAGVPAYLVEIGGELVGHGVKPGMEPWWVELERPAHEHGVRQAVPTRVALHGLAVATSGDYRRYASDGQGIYSHTIDPRSGAPIANGLASVTVLHPECMAADALATALTVLGLDEGLPWAQRRGLAALFVARTADGFLETMTPNFAAMMQ